MFSLLSKWSLVRPQSAGPDLAKLVRETLFYARNPLRSKLTVSVAWRASKDDVRPL